MNRDLDLKRSHPSVQTNASLPTGSPQRVSDTSTPLGFHDVQKGETLFSIAFQHGMDYREIAQWNGIEDVNVLHMGQRLRLTAPEGGPIVTPVTADNGVVVTPLAAEPPVKPSPSIVPAVAHAAAASSSGPLKIEPKAIKQIYSDKAYADLQGSDKIKPEIKRESKVEPSTDSKVVDTKPAAASEDNIEWHWPTKGKAKALFTDSNKGIDISGTRGQSVIAAAPGKVIHVGSNLRGYGKLVIIQHSPMFLSAYAHNNQIIVKEGERVIKGQKIGEMGDSDTDQVKLHFEIRRFGKPVDPLKYLPDEKAS
ncbi:MAG: peptidoglycan DD-metalloendopeptidase family protein [Pseudomonadota bacterium]